LTCSVAAANTYSDVGGWVRPIKETPSRRSQRSVVSSKHSPPIASKKTNAWNNQKGYQYAIKATASVLPHC